MDVLHLEVLRIFRRSRGKSGESAGVLSVNGRDPGGRQHEKLEELRVSHGRAIDFFPEFRKPHSSILIMKDGNWF